MRQTFPRYEDFVRALFQHKQNRRRNPRSLTVIELLEQRTLLTAPAVILPASSLAGYVFHDADNDGIFAGTESGIAGITITLSGQDDLGQDVNLSTVTDTNGAYSFINLRPSGVGGYTLTESQPDGYLDGKDTLGTPGATTGGTVMDDVFANLNLPAGVDGIDNNFGELLSGTITGQVYKDWNYNGVLDDTDETIENVIVTLTGIDDRGQTVNEQTITCDEGCYHFAWLRPGTYQVTETQPAGLLDGLDQAGYSGGTVSNDQISNIIVTSDAVFRGVDFGELPPSSLSGVVYRDLDNNGKFDGADTGIGGVTITLTGTDYLGAPVLQTMFTQADGSYQFDDLLPGTYQLKETQPDGLGDGADTLGTQGGAVCQDSFMIPLEPGVTGVGNNYGELPNGDLSITKVNDDSTNLALENDAIHYTITVSNSGPGLASGATVLDDLPDSILTAATWTATGTDGTAFTAAGTGDLRDNVTIPAGGQVTYHLTVTLNGTFLGMLTNTATVTPPNNGSFVDTVPTNNSSQAVTEVRALNLRTDTTRPDQPVLVVTGIDGPCTMMTIVVGTQRGHSVINGVAIDIADPTTVAVGIASSGSSIMIPATLLKNFKSNDLLIQVIGNSKPVAQVSQLLAVKKDELLNSRPTTSGSNTAGTSGRDTGPSTGSAGSNSSNGGQTTNSGTTGTPATPKGKTPKHPKPPKAPKGKKY